MAQTVRAVYERGQLRLLDDVALAEGQQVSVSILSDMEIARLVLRNILVPALPQHGIREAIDEEALQREIDAELVESPRLAEAVIEERYEDR